MCDWNPKTKNNGWEFDRNQVGWDGDEKQPESPPILQEFRYLGIIYNCNLRCICRIFLFLPDLRQNSPRSLVLKQPQILIKSFVSQKEI